ncbi:hypothetical protein E2C01_085257 [Portunus trituberculatus]|uniref:Uncharacterized protein n=1 Tax=Portunus trituberculatus TaxID=210409 RepID=A0A5B7J0G9_PORTR|nr:hypothetical protein [Portunus trituberculatus]
MLSSQSYITTFTHLTSSPIISPTTLTLPPSLPPSLAKHSEYESMKRCLHYARGRCNARLLEAQLHPLYGRLGGVKEEVAGNIAGRRWR